MKCFTVQRHRATERQSLSWEYKKLPLPIYFTTTSLTAYLQQFVLLNIVIVQLARKIWRYIKGKKKKKFEEPEQVSESDMIGMLELSDWEFKTIVTDMPKALMGRQPARTDNINWDGNSKNEKEMLKIKNAVIRIEKIFDELISRLDTTEERISNLKDAAIESSKTK